MTYWNFFVSLLEFLCVLYLLKALQLKAFRRSVIRKVIRRVIKYVIKLTIRELPLQGQLVSLFDKKTYNVPFQERCGSVPR